MFNSYWWGIMGGFCVYSFYSNLKILVSSPVPLGLIGFLNLLGFGWGSVEELGWVGCVELWPMRY
mgnify:CR=1 FL=1